MHRRANALWAVKYRRVPPVVIRMTLSMIGALDMGAPIAHAPGGRRLQQCNVSGVVTFDKLRAQAAADVAVRGEHRQQIGAAGCYFVRSWAPCGVSWRCHGQVCQFIVLRI